MFPNGHFFGDWFWTCMYLLKSIPTHKKSNAYSSKVITNFQWKIKLSFKVFVRELPYAHFFTRDLWHQQTENTLIPVIRKNINAIIPKSMQRSICVRVDKKDGLGFVLYIYKIGSLILGLVSYLQLSSCVVWTILYLGTFSHQLCVKKEIRHTLLLSYPIESKQIVPLGDITLTNL